MDGLYYSHGVRGAERTVLVEMARMLSAGQRVSVTRLADATGYSNQTTWRAIQKLRDAGIIEMEHPCNGSWAEYKIKGGPMGVLSSIINFFTMDNQERIRRFLVAIDSNAVYEDAERLSKYARRIGGDFQRRAEALIDENGLLDVARVWHDQTELARLRNLVNEMLDMADELQR